MITPDQYGVVGHPINHSWSPFIHGLFAKQTEQSLVYRLYDITPEDFRVQVLEFFTRGGRGLNVTVPHKEAAAEIANELTVRADRAGAVNTLMLRDDHVLVGDNTDGQGLVTDLRQRDATYQSGRTAWRSPSGSRRSWFARGWWRTRRTTTDRSPRGRPRALLLLTDG